MSTQVTPKQLLQKLETKCSSPLHVIACDRIRKLREELGITQGELAARLGINSRVRITELENGKHDLTLGMLERISKALGVSSKQILFGTSDE